MKIVNGGGILQKNRVKKQKIATFLYFKTSKICDYDTTLQGNSSIRAAVHSSPPSKNPEQNNVGTLNDVANLRQVVKGQVKYSESQGKSGKPNTVISYKKLVKEESVKDSDSKVSSINTISEKNNTAKGIKLNKKYQNLQLQDSSELHLLAFDICTF